MSRYMWADFLRACSSGDAGASKKARLSADKDFHLSTETDILAFIASGGLEQPVAQPDQLWKNNPDPKTQIWVDSYEFTTGPKRGYIAFLFQPKTQKWLIKSFKLSDSSALTHSPFAAAFAAGFLKKGDDR